MQNLCVMKRLKWEETTLVLVEAARSIKNVMVSNTGDDDLEEVSDLFIDPITGEVQAPEEGHSLDSDEDEDPATMMLEASALEDLDENTGQTENIEGALRPGESTLPDNILEDSSVDEISNVFEAADLDAANSGPDLNDPNAFVVGEAGTVMGDDPIGAPPPLPSIPDVETKAPEILPEPEEEADPINPMDANAEEQSEEAPDLPTAILTDVVDTEVEPEAFATPEDLESAKREMAEDAAAVDGFLESAVLATDLAIDEEEDSGTKLTGSTEDPEASFFQVSLRNVSQESAKARILRVAEREKLVSDIKSLRKRLDELGGYRFSHLREYQATVLMQELQQLDVECRLDIPAFDGDSDFPESSSASLFRHKENEVESTGAQAVELPKNSKEILLSTVDQIAGHEITEEKGVLSAHSSVARTFFRSEEQDIRLAQKIDHLQPNTERGKELRLPRAEMDNVFEKLLKRIQREAMRRGANAVIGIQISGFPEANAIDPEADQIRLIASGTAVVLRSQIENESN